MTMTATRFTIALLALTTAAVAQHEPLLAVTFPAQDSVGFVQVEGPPRFPVKKSVPVGKSPGPMCTDPAGKTLFVAMPSGAAAIDLASFTVSGNFSDTFKRPFSCVVSPEGKKLYIADAPSNVVSVFAVATHQLVKKITTPEDPRIGIFLPNGKLVVSCGDGGELAVIDPATDSVMRTIKVIGLDPRGMVITPDGKNLIVALVSSDILSWYKADTLDYINSFGITRSPQGIVIADNGERLYVNGAAEQVIGVVELREKNHEGTPEPRQTSTIPLGQAYNLTANPEATYLFSATSDGTGVVIDLRSYKILKPASLKGAGNMLYIK